MGQSLLLRVENEALIISISCFDTISSEILALQKALSWKLKFSNSDPHATFLKESFYFAT